MIRTLSLFLVLAVAAEASAQTAPAKATVRTQTTKRRAAATVRKTNTTAETGGRDDIGPGGNGAVGSTENADNKGQNTYAAPGMPVNVDNPKKVEGYNGPAPTKARTGNTLSPK